jgi:hypothetical protein
MKIKDLRRALDGLALDPDMEDLARLSAALEALDNVDIEDFHRLIAPSIAKRAKSEAKAQQAKLAAEKKLRSAAA